MTALPLAVASNRGPVAMVRRADGTFEARRGVGGLVTALGGALHGREALWVASALSDDDREAARRADGCIEAQIGSGTIAVRLIDVGAEEHGRFYNEFSNRVLWFLHHYLWAPPVAPAFGRAEAESWEAFMRVNHRFAVALAEDAHHGAVALPQDYHFSLVPSSLREMRPDLRIAHFWHIPFCEPDQYGILPDRWGRALLEGLLAADVVGFQTPRWADNFAACCREVLGARASRRSVRHNGRSTKLGIYPVGVAGDKLGEEAARPEVARELESIDALAGDRTLLLRVDRTELSKNIARGLLAYEELLGRRADLRGRVVQLVLLAPSRHEVPEYREYMDGCREIATRINERFGGRDWMPVVLEIEDNYARALAGFRRYDVLVVNSVYDGMNLVAREGPTLNERGGVLVLSRNAGAALELGPAALLVNPFDVAATASALERAIEMPREERTERAERLKTLAQGLSPEKWLDAQVRDAARSR